MSRKGNIWIEPLRDWIKTAHHAEKLASTKDFYEMKSFVEKIGTNRRLLNRVVLFDFQKPFDFIPKYKGKFEVASFAPSSAGREISSQTPPCFIWSGRLDSNQRLHGPEPCALPCCATPRQGIVKTKCA